MDSPAKSYDAKYAVEMVFRNNNVPSSNNLGKALKEVMEFKTIRGKFDGQHVHQDLKNLGVTEIILGEDHVDFKGRNIYEE